MKAKRIAALVPNVLGKSPGQRMRIEAWAPYLAEAGWQVDFYPFESESLHEVLYQPGHSMAKVTSLLECYARHLKRFIEGVPSDAVFIFREAALIGPALIERLAALSRKPIVYDLDDPIFLPYRSPMNGWFSLLKFSRKTHSLFRLSHRVISINGLIADYVRQYNPSVSVIPNCVDVERYRAAERNNSEPVRLCWIGSHSTIQNLAKIASPLRRLQTHQQVPLRIIGAGAVELPGVDFETRQWAPETEVADLQACDIGVVPLVNHPWNDWKFFFKTIQYMAVGLPVVAERTGSNTEVIEDGVNGFLVESEEQWHDRLQTLIEDAALRRKMGAAARKTVVEKYSVQAQMPALISIFDGVALKSCVR